MDIDGAKVRVRVEGDKDAEPIILLHGFSFSLESWNDWAAGLKENYKVIRYDLLGHGLTGKDPKSRYAPEERAEFLGKILEKLNIQQAVIAGNSLGGLVAWRYAHHHPEKVKALILVAPGGYSINGVTDTPLEAPAAVQAYFRNPPEIGVQYSLTRLFSNPALVTPKRVKRAKDMITINDNGEEFIKSIAEFTLPDPSSALSALKAPTLILWGKKDMVIPIDHSAKFQSAIDGAELITYDNAGHIPQEEIPEQSLKDVSLFLGKITK
jgi:pimeloyl-ACP methyl ester carboxylesterase